MGSGSSNDIFVNGDIWEQKRKKQSNKVLILGSDVCGKLMLFNQLKWIYGNNGFYASHSKDELKNMLGKIRQNMVQSMIIIINESQILYEMDEHKYTDCKLDFDDEKEMKIDNKQIQNDIEYLIQFKNETFIESSKTVKELELLGESMNHLWNIDGIKNTFKYRHEFELKQNMDYFFDKSIKIFKENYICTKNDCIILCERNNHDGLDEMMLEPIDEYVQPVAYQIIHINQPLISMHKWIDQFSDTDAIIFIAALDGFCQV